MKHFILLFALFVSSLLSAQSIWLQQGQIWQYKITLGFSGSVESVAFVEGDTLVLGKTVKKVKALTPHPSGGSLTPDRFAYADGGKVWMYSNKLNDFTRLYDFDLSVGDTLTFPSSYNNYNLRYRIDSIGSAQFSGQARRFQRVRFIGTNGVPFQPSLIIEGIGLVGDPQEFNHPQCSYFFIDDRICAGAVDGPTMLFICFHENGYTYAPYAGDCSLVSTHEPDLEPIVRIFPNPATETFQVQMPTEQGGVCVRLLNVHGQVLYTSMDSTLPVSVETFPIGLYFIEITLKNGNKVIRKVVKE